MTLSVNGKEEALPINGKALLMRETNLKNCEYIYGLVVYVGNDTKIQRSNMEGEKAKTKKSRIMRWVEKFLGGMVLFQTSACLFAAFYCGIWTASHHGDWYLAFEDSAGVSGVLAYFTWFILLSQVVPISLIVSAELVKFVQSWFIQKDITMYYEPIDKPTKCNSHTIHEDLGLIDYIFR
jgi:magnesium-transporting ATPase (P-type)